MPQQPGLFRKAALDRMASPERLDVLMQVTSPFGWVALCTVGALLLGVLLWSIFGSIPTRVEGEGILIQGGTLREIRSSGDGDLLSLKVRVNDIVKPDQVLGEITQLDYGERVKSVEGRYADAKREATAAEAEDQATITGLQADIQSAQSEIRTTEQELAKATEDLRLKQQSLAKGLITKSRVTTAERDTISMRGRVATLRAQIRGSQANIRAVEQRIRSRYQSADTINLEVARLKGTGTLAGQIKSTVSGRVVEVKKNAGDRVTAGEVIAVVEPDSATTEPVLYVTSTTGKQIRPGMEAQVAPSTVKREEYGFIRAKVTYVGEYPVTPQAVQTVVANQALAQELIGATTKIEVRASLTRDTHTPSGYAWSSSAGPAFRIQSGTRISVAVVVDRRAPITLVLPAIRNTFGLS
jgi:HlyD family secretion protein